MKISLLLVCSVIAVCLVPSRAFSQADTVVVTANRLKQHSYKVAGNLTVINQSQIQASNARTIPDILSEALGVHVYDNSTPKSAVVDIRGFGETATRNVLILINGRKINSIDVSGPDLVQIPIESVERIEILRGAGTVLYGDNAVGGVVNIITKQGAGDNKVHVGAVYGSYDTRGTDVGVSGEKQGVSYFAYGKYANYGGYRQNSDLEAKDYNVRLGYDISDMLAVDLETGWHEDTQRLPGGLSDADLSTFGRRYSSKPDDYSETKDRYIKLGFDYVPFPEDDYVGDIVVDLYYRNRDVYDSFRVANNGNLMDFYNTKRETNTFGLNAKYIFDKFLFNREVSFVAGTDYFYNDNNILGSGSNTDDLTITKSDFGIYGFLQYELIDDVFVNGGTRYHVAEYDFDQRAGGDEGARPEEWVSMMGVKWEYTPQSNIHANVQQTFRFLATDEWYSTFTGLDLELEQQTGVQYEVGIRHQLSEAMVVTATPYLIELNNEIYFDPAELENKNYDKTRRMGLEIGQEIDLLKWWDVDHLDQLEFYSNYTYQEAEFVEGTNDGNQVPMVPEYQFGAGLRMAFLDYYRLSLSGRYVGNRFAINDTQNIAGPIKPYTVVDTKLAYKRDWFEIYLAVNNVFDERYETFTSKATNSLNRSHFPAPERNYMMGVNLEF